MPKFEEKENKEKADFEARRNLPSFSIPRKTKEKLNIRFKFDDLMSEEKGDEVLFRVFDILLSTQKKELIKVKKNNENNRGSNRADKA